MSDLSDSTVLVTGGSGFIGSHLCERLLERGNRVICLDNISSGRELNVAHLRDNEQFRFIRADVCDPSSFEGLGEVTHIFNLACPASPPFYQRDPIHVMHTNVVGAYNVLEFARHVGARVLQTSTSEVYGDPLEHPQRETYRGNVNCDGIRACYDEGKRAAEATFFDFHRQYGVDIRIVRIFNTYGPHMRPDDGRVVSNFICQAIKGEDITVYGDGMQTRSFCYVDDLVRGLLAMMSKEGFTGPVNLGNPEEHTMLELAQAVIGLTDSSSRLVHEQLPADDPTRRKPDITLAKQMLGWEPTTPLIDGLARTIRYFRGVLDG